MKFHAKIKPDRSQHLAAVDDKARHEECSKIMSDVVQKWLIGRQNVSLLASFYAGSSDDKKCMFCLVEIVLT